MNSAFVRKLLGFALLLCGLALFLPAEEAIAQDRTIHTVAAGETLFSISRRYDVSVSDIQRWNNLRGTNIQVGQRLYVSPAGRTAPASRNDTPPPPVEPTETPDTEFVRHQVRSGETLFSLSRRYGVTVNDLRTWNNLTTDLLEIGQILEIRKSTRNITTPPVTQRPATDTTLADANGLRPEADRPGDVDDNGTPITAGTTQSAYYVVRAGDTLAGIARAHNLTLSEIMELNRLRNDRLAVGQVLLVRRPQGLPSVPDAETGTTPQGRFVTYQIGRGERATDVLRKFEMTEYEFSALNPDINIAELREGQSVTVLLPPDIIYANPYRDRTHEAGETVETIRVHRYNDTDRGRSTTSGDLYTPSAFTAAHNRLPLGSVIFVENSETGMGLFVLINDRMVESGLRLSHAAFEALGFEPNGDRTAVISTSF